MNAITETPNKSRSATKQVDLLKVKDLLIKSADTISNILNSKWMWSSQAKAIGLTAYHGGHGGIKDSQELIEKMSELLCEAMRTDEASAIGSDLVAELQQAAESISGLPAGS